MAAQDLLTSYSVQQRNMFSTEWPNDEGIYPEQRLWIAVIINAITDYEEKLRHIEKLWKNGKVLPQFLLTLVQTMRYEVRHEWFERICELANYPHEDVVARLRQLDKQYKLSEIEFTDDSRVRPVEINKVKKRFQHG